MRAAYKIVLSQTEDGYFVRVPDLNCNTQGKDIADAIFMARDVICLMGTAMEDDGEVVPAPGTVSFEVSDGDIVTYVDVDFAEYRKKYDTRKVKKTLNISSWVNERAEAANINFSRVLEEALIEKLNVN